MPLEVQNKIKAFYSLNHETYGPMDYIKAVNKLPHSLHTDVMLSLNAKMINKVNIFNFGSPNFIMRIAQHMYPKIGMPGDYICKVGEFADEMYFIKQGEVEVLATDGTTRLAVLKPGAYFGEIGIFILGRRSVYVRCITVCILEAIQKNEFLTILEDFPD